MKGNLVKEIKKKTKGKLKDYLNSEELNDFMTIGMLLETSGDILESKIDEKVITLGKIRIAWDTRGNLSKEEHKAIKTAETYLTKAYRSILNRLSKNEAIKIQRRLNTSYIRILDKYTIDKINRETADKYKNAVIPRVQFEDWCEVIMQVKCKGCTKDRQACKLREVFEDNFVPESDWGLDNCRYAYNELEILGAKMPRVLKENRRG